MFLSSKMTNRLQRQLSVSLEEREDDTEVKEEDQVEDAENQTEGNQVDDAEGDDQTKEGEGEGEGEDTEDEGADDESGSGEPKEDDAEGNGSDDDLEGAEDDAETPKGGDEGDVEPDDTATGDNTESEGDGEGDGTDNATEGDNTESEGDGEGDDNVTEGDIVESEEIVLDEVAKEILDANSEKEEMDDDVEDIESLEQIACGLESLASFCRDSLEDGGLTQREAHLVGQLADGYGAPMQVESIVPSMESFGVTGSRVNATNVSVESLAEKAKQAGRALLDLLEKIYAKGVELWKRYFGIGENLVKIGKNLQSVDKGTKIVEGDIELSDKDLENLSGVSNISSGIGDLIDALAIAGGAEVVSYCNRVAAINLDDFKESDVIETGKEFPKFKFVNKDSDDSVGENLVAKESAPFIGGLVVKARFAEGDNAKAYGKQSYSTERVEQDKANLSAIKVDAIISLGEIVEQAGNAILEFKDSPAFRELADSKLKTRVSELSKKLEDVDGEGDDTEQKSKFISQAVPLFNGASTLLQQPAGNLANHLANVTKSAVAHAKASVDGKLKVEPEAKGEGEAQTA